MLQTTKENGFVILSEDYQSIATYINQIVPICYGSALAAGWYDKIADNGTRFMLMVSEISEAMEGDRKNLMDDKLPHRKMTEVELADACIRIFDFAGRNNYDLGGAIAEKIHFNQSRPDHKRENRIKEGGKAY